MIRIPVSRHVITPRALFVDTNREAVLLGLVGADLTKFARSELTSGEARYLAEALIDAAGRVEAAAAS